MAQTRQLAVIMFTDIVGYTVLMGDDEQKAFDFLNRNRGLHKPIIEQFNGRWIKELGDGVMASFNTVSDAVQAAIKIQEACNQTNDFQLRIGIHLGEVVFENEDVFGDGVNIAARIQSAARPGSIYVSESVHHNVSNKAGIETRFINQEVLKNVKEPVRIYEVLIKKSPSPSMSTELVPTTSKPISPKSIAVLPFVNMSSDPEQDYFSDGITEEIITDLSHLRDLLVISRSSIMTFKNTQKRIRDISRELNVHYLLEGSVRKAGNNLRITAQLIDADTDAHIWAEKYQGTLDDVFEIQEKVARSIVESLKLKLTPQENQVIAARPINNVHAYDCYLHARSEQVKWTKDGIDKARQYLKNGLDIIGPNATLYAGMAYVHFNYANMGFQAEDNYRSAEDYIKKTFALDPESPEGHLVEGLCCANIYANMSGFIHHLKRVLAVNPNDLDALWWLCWPYIFVGKYELALPLVAKMLQLDPLSANVQIMPDVVHVYSGKFELMEEPYSRAFTMDPSNPAITLIVSFFFIYRNRRKEALVFITHQVKPGVDDFFFRMVYALKHALLKEKDTVSALLQMKDFKNWAWEDYWFSYLFADIYALAGLNTEAMDWLERSIVRGHINYPFISRHDPALEELRKEERFVNLMKEVKIQCEKFEV